MVVVVGGGGGGGERSCFISRGCPRSAFVALPCPGGGVLPRSNVGLLVGET